MSTGRGYHAQVLAAEVPAAAGSPAQAVHLCHKDLCWPVVQSTFVISHTSADLAVFEKVLGLQVLLTSLEHSLAAACLCQGYLSAACVAPPSLSLL